MHPIETLKIPHLYNCGARRASKITLHGYTERPTMSATKTGSQTDGQLTLLSPQGLEWLQYGEQGRRND